METSDDEPSAIIDFHLEIIVYRYRLNDVGCMSSPDSVHTALPFRTTSNILARDKLVFVLIVLRFLCPSSYAILSLGGDQC
jgi:hypothetical protein